MSQLSDFDVDFVPPKKAVPTQLSLPLPDPEAEARAKQSNEQTQQFLFNAEAARISNSLLGLI